MQLFFCCHRGSGYRLSEMEISGRYEDDEEEVKDEYKQSEGDPKVKSQQKSRMQQASRQRMMQELPNADVVITNPTHLAVAIRYDKEKHEAPVVVAKGADYLAAKIKVNGIKLSDRDRGE